MTAMNAGSPASSVTEAETQLQNHLERKVLLYVSFVSFNLLHIFFKDCPSLQINCIPAGVLDVPWAVAPLRPHSYDWGLTV